MKYWLFVITVLFALLIFALVIAANTNHLPSSLVRIQHFPYGDKVGHFTLFGILSFLLSRSALYLFPSRNPSRLLLTINLLLSLLIGLEEWSQSLFPTRTMSGKDLVASYLGVILFGFLAYRTGR